MTGFDVFFLFCWWAKNPIQKKAQSKNHSCNGRVNQNDQYNYDQYFQWFHIGTTTDSYWLIFLVSSWALFVSLLLLGLGISRIVFISEFSRNSTLLMIYQKHSIFWEKILVNESYVHGCYLLPFSTVKLDFNPKEKYPKVSEVEIFCTVHKYIPEISKECAGRFFWKIPGRIPK